MDNLHILSASSKSSSRSASPGRPLSAMLGSTPSPGPSKGSHSVLRSGDGSSGSTSSGAGISGSNRQRRKSPLPSRKDAHGTENISAIHLDPLSHDYKFGNSQDDVEVFLPASSHLSNGSSEHITSDEPDVPSSSTSADATRTKGAIEHMQNKISRTKDQIRVEQAARDENVNEYLKLAANADKQQLQRIKSVFEKKNQKSAQSISQLQKKLESYNKRLRELETYGVHSSHRQPREVLRDVGQGLKNVGGNIRDGISGFSGGVVENIKGGFHGAAETVMSKPREFAHLLKNKFGSADNINSLSRNGDSNSADDDKTHHGSATLPGNCTLSAPHASSSAGAIKFTSDEGSPCSSVTSESIPPGQVTHQSSPKQLVSGTYNLDPMDPILAELQERKEEIERLKEKIESFKNVQVDLQFLSQGLHDEKYRYERLEEQINDLTELHQNEVENLKQALADMEEKVQYQSEERLRDIHEMLENCQTKISKMEHQQAQHQQYVTLEGIDNSNARALVVKLINVLLTVLQVVLLLVATAAGILMPFLKTRLRILSTLALIAGMVFILKQWPEVKDVGSHLMRHIKEALSVK